MELTTGNILLIGSILLFVAIFAAKTSARFGTPMLLLFLFVGMLFGVDGVGIEFNNPAAAQFIGMVALCVILFSGGMDTKFSEIKPVLGEGLVLATFGVLLTAALTGLFVYSIGGLFNLNITLLESFLLAAVMSSTDSASVFSILRSKKKGLKQNLRPLLELESGSNDPIAYILTILLVEAVAMGGEISVWQSVMNFVIQMSVGAIAGFLLGELAVKMLNKINLQNKSLYSVLLLSIVFFIFSVTDLINGNGYLAVYIAGLVVGNHKIVFQKSLTTFFDGFTWLFQIVMFIALGLLVNPNELLGVWSIGLMVGAFMILVGRPLSVFISLLPFRKVTAKARLYVSWVGLRGAVPIIFATYPWVAGLDNAGLIFNTVFFITIMSLLIQGTTVSSMADKLGLSTELEEDGFGIDMPEQIRAALAEMEVKPEFLAGGDTLREINLDPNTLVMMIRRGDNYIIPKGDTKIMVGDKILFISSDTAQLPADYAVTKTSRREKIKRRLAARAQGRRSGHVNDEDILTQDGQYGIIASDPDDNDAIPELEVEVERELVEEEQS